MSDGILFQSHIVDGKKEWTICIQGVKDRQTTNHATKCHFLTCWARFLKTLTDVIIVLYFTVVFIAIYFHVYYTQLQSVNWGFDWLNHCVWFRVESLSQHDGLCAWQPRIVNARHFKQIDWILESVLLVTMSTAGDGEIPFALSLSLSLLLITVLTISIIVIVF